MEVTEEAEIVIIGGGICGLATALAFHRKGIESIVLEKWKTVRTTGAAIIVQPNGWHALHQLRLASSLHHSSLPLLSGETVFVEDGKREAISVGAGELRCFQRKDLMNALIKDLPSNTIRFGSNVISVEMDSFASSSPVIHLEDGSKIRSKVVIGCDGVNSVMGTKLGLNNTKRFSTCVIRGVTATTSSHELGNKFLVLRNRDVQLGLFPISCTLIYWFITRKIDLRANPKEQGAIKELAIESMEGYPEMAMKIVRKSEEESLHMTNLKYRDPWEILRGRLRIKGRATVAGDAMHAMGPFLAQGGSASLEDAVVLAQCLSRCVSRNGFGVESTETALRQYVKCRRMRVFWLSLQTCLIGNIIESTSLVHKVFFVFILMVLFRDGNGHSSYRCGTL